MLKAAREKRQVIYKGNPNSLIANLLAETLKARTDWGILKEQNLQPRISYPTKLNFIIEGEIKSFMDEQLLRDFVTTRSALQELPKEALNIERNNQYEPF